MATRTKDIALLKKEKRGTSPSTTTKTKPLVQKQPNHTASTKNAMPNKQTLTQGKRLTSLHDPNTHNKQPPSLSVHANTQTKNPPLSTDANNIHNKPTLARRRSIDFRPPPPSSTLQNAQVKKLLPSSSSDSNIHSKQSLARRSSLDYRAALTSGLDHTHGKKLPSSSSDPNIHSKQALTRTLDHKPPLSSPLPKNRTSPNPKERILRPSLSLSSKPSTSQKPLISKIPHVSIGKKHSPALYARAMKQDSPAGLTSTTFVTSNVTDIVENIVPKDEELEQVEHQEPIDNTYDEMEAAEAGESGLVMEDYEGLNEIVNIDEYLKAAESSLYVVENQEVIKMEVPEEQVLVEETRISNHKEVEEDSNEPCNLDLEDKEIQESVIKAVDENQEEAKGEESEIIVKALDDCQQEKEEGKEIEEKELDVNILQQEKEEENEERSKEKESREVQENKTTMAFAKPYPHLLQGNKKESVVSNDVIEETASKLREQRKNRVKALAGAFETVISLQDPRT